MYPTLHASSRLKLHPDISFLYLGGSQETLVFPVNKSAAAILALCDGRNSEEQVVQRLCVYFGETQDKVRAFTDAFICKSVEAGTIHISESPAPADVKLFGSFEYWVPMQVSIAVTLRCALRCQHCYIGDRVASDIDRQALKSLCLEIIELGVDRVHFTGGEPLLFLGLRDAISLLGRSGVLMSLSTSGYIATDYSELDSLTDSLKELDLPRFHGHADKQSGRRDRSWKTQNGVLARSTPRISSLRP